MKPKKPNDTHVWVLAHVGLCFESKFPSYRIGSRDMNCAKSGGLDSSGVVFNISFLLPLLLNSHLITLTIEEGIYIDTQFAQGAPSKQLPLTEFVNDNILRAWVKEL
jgi:hypothetical protein